MSLISPELPNVSLVAFYGPKPLELSNLIRQLQQQLLEQFPQQFQPYPLEQIHATLIGCEGFKIHLGIVSQWFHKHRHQVKFIDLAGFLDYLFHSPQFPFLVKIGGYWPGENYSFLSQGQGLFERSLQISNNMAVLIGWPVQTGIVQTLDQFRREAQAYNLLHKYHSQPDRVDNDCYLRLGWFTQKPAQTPRLEPLDSGIHPGVHRMREYLATSPPLYLTIDRTDLAFVGYQDFALSPETTQVMSLATATVEQLEALYPKVSN
ncbi:MAG: hypothetical protein HC835_02245 [Oscillatoriales cyanobacterium RM2_1_1]|nr:hypothetical protein [Oscillatoriales cyanobacterium SM2_3_0]NJO44539.1 hypothetical protein [Oscillatoriales cyanobacterium RM2_1_1]